MLPSIVRHATALKHRLVAPGVFCFNDSVKIAFLLRVMLALLIGAAPLAASTPAVAPHMTMKMPCAPSGGAAAPVEMGCANCCALPAESATPRPTRAAAETVHADPVAALAGIDPALSLPPPRTGLV